MLPDCERLVDPLPLFETDPLPEVDREPLEVFDPEPEPLPDPPLHGQKSFENSIVLPQFWLGSDGHPLPAASTPLVISKLSDILVTLNW